VQRKLEGLVRCGVGLEQGMLASAAVLTSLPPSARFDSSRRSAEAKVTIGCGLLVALDPTFVQHQHLFA
jgi:hypothetical protein